MSLPLATRMAWTFAAMFLCGLLVIAAFAYFEMVVEPTGDEAEPIMQGVMETAVEAVFLVALLSIGGWWLARRALRPLELLANAAERIHEGNLTERIQLAGSATEYEKLTQVFNSMTGRLNASFQRVKQFTLSASHELKTPLSILHLEFERMLDDPRRNEDDRTQFSKHLDEIDRLARIVNGLAFLAKTDSDLIQLFHEPVEMRPLLQSAAEDTTALAAEMEINVGLGQCDEIIWLGDRHSLRQLLVILCDNAVKYNRSGGNIQLSLENLPAGSVLRIENTGGGIPPEDHARVFDRFYRGSSAQADGVDGCGLGLSIAQWIVTKHGGNLSFTSDANRTVFTIMMPGPIS